MKYKRILVVALPSEITKGVHIDACSKTYHLPVWYSQVIRFALFNKLCDLTLTNITS